MIDILDLAYAQNKSLHKRKQTDRENKQREVLSFKYLRLQVIRIWMFIKEDNI